MTVSSRTERGRERERERETERERAVALEPSALINSWKDNEPVCVRSVFRLEPPLYCCFFFGADREGYTLPVALQVNRAKLVDELVPVVE